MATYHTEGGRGGCKQRDRRGSHLKYKSRPCQVFIGNSSTFFFVFLFSTFRPFLHFFIAGMRLIRTNKPRFCHQLPMYVTTRKERKETLILGMYVWCLCACVCMLKRGGDKREYSSRRINSCYSDLHGSLHRKHWHCPKSLPAVLILIYF